MEIRYNLWSEMSEPEVIALPSGMVCIYSSPRPTEDRPNEDGVMLVTTRDGRTVLAVADGAGGHRESQRTASLALRALGRELERADGEGDRLRDAILDGIEAGNRVLLRRGSGAPTTIAVAQIASDGLFDNLQLDEIVDTVRIRPPRQAMSTLVEACRQRMRAPQGGLAGNPDDLTVVLYRGVRSTLS